MAATFDGSLNGPSKYDSVCPIDPRFASFIDHDVLEEASHELRTPLSSIRNSLTLLKLGAAGEIPQDALDVIDVVDRNTVRLMNLIEEILFAQRVKLIFEPVAVDLIVHNSIEMVAGEAKSKNIAIQFDPSEQMVLGDAQKLEQVITNLLSNAVKFSPVNSRVTVSAQMQSARSVSISVTDQGTGVPPTDSDRIFEKHQQGVGQRTKGAGLGLAISKRIIEQHGGQIGLKNGIDSGATFWIRLKRSAANEIKNPSLPISQTSISGGRVA